MVVWLVLGMLQMTGKVLRRSTRQEAADKNGKLKLDLLLNKQPVQITKQCKQV